MSGLQFSLRSLLLAVAMFSADCAILVRSSWEGAILIVSAAVLIGLLMIGMTICVAVENGATRRVRWYKTWLDDMFELGLPLVTVWSIVTFMIGLMNLLIELNPL